MRALPRCVLYECILRAFVLFFFFSKGGKVRTMENYKWCTISFVLFTFLLVHYDTCVCVMLFCLLFVSVSSVILSFRSTINVKLCQSDIIRLKQFKELSWQKAKFAVSKVNKNNSGYVTITKQMRALSRTAYCALCVCVWVWQVPGCHFAMKTHFMTHDYRKRGYFLWFWFSWSGLRWNGQQIDLKGTHAHKQRCNEVKRGKEGKGWGHKQ